MHRILQVIMAILMIAAIYSTYRYYVIPSSTNVRNGKIVVIDPGHGGVDPGKIGINGVYEKDVNLAIAVRLKKALEEKGYEVILTRKDDNGLYNENDANKKSSDMKNRCRIISESSADIVVSIHQNSFSSESVHGAQVFYYKQSENGRMLAECIQCSITENADKENSRKVKDNTTYYMLLHTPCPTVIVECGFMSNSIEAEKLSGDEYQQQMADAISIGVENYFSKLSAEQKVIRR